MKILFHRIMSCATIAALTLVSLTAIFPAKATAFSSNNIMDDSIFENVSSMTAGQIDSFLNSHASSCISPNRGFQSRVPSGYTPSGGFTYGANATAGEVIARSAQVYGLNPQVLLATLQKEQSIVTGAAGCSTQRLSKVAGYGCPDSGGSYNYTGLNLFTLNGTTYTDVSGICVNSAAKAGFSQQVIRAAWMLRFSQQRSLGNTSWAVITGSWDNSDDPGSCYGGAMTQGYRKRCSSDQNATFYDGYTTIDGQSTHIDTGATAAFYRYTPHFSGNQNLTTIFTGWFGSMYGNTIGSTTYRLFNPRNGKHYYTARENNRASIKKRGFNDDGSNIFKVSATQEAGMIPIYLLYNGRLNDHWFLPDGSNFYWAVIYGGYGVQEVAFYAYPINPNPTPENPLCPAGSTPLYQMWHGRFQDHFYSINGGDHYWGIVSGGYVDDGSSLFKDGNGGVSFCMPL